MQVKCKIINITFEFLNEKFGEKKLQSFLEENQEYKKFTSLSSADWVNIEPFLKFLEKMDKYFGYGDLSLIEESGEYSAKKAFKSSHMVFKNIDLNTFINISQPLLRSYFSEGIIESKNITSKKIEFFIDNFINSKILQKRIKGWLKQGLKEMINEKKCIIKEKNNSKCMEFVIEIED